MSKEQKLIMEGWRDFLSAATLGHVDHRKRKEVEFSASLADVALYVDEDGDRTKCFLYIPAGFSGGTPVIDNVNKPKLVGFVTLDKLSSSSQPCIPNTYQVSFSAVAAEFQRKGMGTLLYNIAATIAKNKGGGITSDHKSSTSPSAGRVWKKLERSINYTKRSTPDGSDKFDYTGTETPFDDQDDCPSTSWGKPASDHSLEIIAGIDAQIDQMRRNNKKYIKSAVRITDAKMKLLLDLSANETFFDVIGRTP